MALQKTALKNGLKTGLIQIFSSPQTQSNVNTIADQLATLLADKIDTYVKTGKATGTDSNGDTHNLPIT